MSYIIIFVYSVEAGSSHTPVQCPVPFYLTTLLSLLHTLKEQTHISPGSTHGDFQKVGTGSHTPAYLETLSHPSTVLTNVMGVA